MGGVQARTLVVASGETIYEGTIVCIDSSGFAIAATGNNRVAGIAQNGATEGETVTVYFQAAWRFTADPAPVATDIGKPVYLQDNDTVTNSSGTGICGICEDITATEMWVFFTTRA